MVVIDTNRVNTDTMVRINSAWVCTVGLSFMDRVKGVEPSFSFLYALLVRSQRHYTRKYSECVVNNGWGFDSPRPKALCPITVTLRLRNIKFGYVMPSSV
jgi:hypothetical protein